MNRRIIKSDIVAQMAEQSNLSRKSINELLSATFRHLISGVCNDGSASIHGFGRFELTEHKEKRVRNPQTGEMQTVDAKTSVKFTPCTDLKERVNARNAAFLR